MTPTTPTPKNKFEARVLSEYIGEHLFDPRVVKSYRLERDLVLKIAETARRLRVSESTVVRAALRQAMVDR